MANIKCNGQIESKTASFDESLFFRGKTLLDSIYGLGAIYISTNPISPASLFGGVWLPLAEENTFWTKNWTAETSEEAGQYISAGLPNITGDATLSSGRWDSIEYSGFVSAPADWIETAGHMGNSWRQRGFRVSFDASRSSSIYGNSSTVQPSAIKVYAWKRIS